jgi:hypothetical protein
MYPEEIVYPHEGFIVAIMYREKRMTTFLSPKDLLLHAMHWNYM